MLGGIKLQVRESEAQDARAILHATHQIILNRVT